MTAHQMLRRRLIINHLHSLLSTAVVCLHPLTRITTFAHRR